MEVNQMCRQCILHSGVPGVTINEAGFCNECVDYDKAQSQSNTDEPEGPNRDAELTQKMEELFAKVKQQNNWYDAIVLLSGGKDSTYLLDLAKNKYQLRVLAFSMIYPISKKQAAQNIDDAVKIFNVDSIKFVPDESMYKKLMKYGLLEGHQYDLREGVGCATCSFLFFWVSIKLAMKLKIPIILDGRDKAQTGPVFTDGETYRERIANGGKPFGRIHDLFSDATGEEYRGSIYDYNPAEFENAVFPTSIAPFTFLEYDYRKNFEEFEALGLNSHNFNTMFTNCDGVYLFDYIALKKYNCTSYIHSDAAGVRKAQPTITQLNLDPSVSAETSVSRQTALAVMDEYKQLLYYVTGKKLTRDNVSQADKDAMRAIVNAGYRIYSKEVVEMMLDRILSVYEFVDYLGIDLS
jgi:hypothetical protein